MGPGAASVGLVGVGWSSAQEVSLEVQRAHLYQDILPLNDFRARLITVRFSREF